MRTLPASLLALALAACTEDAPRRAHDSATPARPAAAPASPAGAAALPAVAVQIESPHEDIDACSLGAVRAAAGGRVAVRSGPGTGYAVVDSLLAGATFHACDGSQEGWSGIVYQRDTDPKDTTQCGGLTSPVPEKRAYTGPCRSGWIPTDSRAIVAG